MPKPSRRRPVEHRREESPAPAIPRGHVAEPLRMAVFFGLFFVYLWLWVQPCLIYSCGTITNFPVFYRGWAFFTESAPRPGGLVAYVSALLSQSFEFSGVGAVVITAQAWALSLCTGCFLRRVGLPGSRLLRFVPALLVLAADARYSYHFPLFMGALTSIALACLYAMLTPARATKRVLWDLAVYLALSLVLYVIAGAALLPFAAMCIAYELRHRRWWQIGLYALIAAVLPYLLGVLVFRISLPNAYTELLPVSWRVLGWPARERMAATVYAAYLFPILAALVSSTGILPVSSMGVPPMSIRGILPLSCHGQDARGTHGRDGRATAYTRPVVLWPLGTLVLFAAGGAVAFFAPDRQGKAMLQVHHYACRRMWPQVLVAARDCPDNRYAMNAVNRALYHTGRLSRDMFLYPQHPDNLLVTGEDQVLRYWHAFDTLTDLGLLNLAEKNLTECLETFGEQPMILERLARVNLAKGRTDAAQIWLGALHKTLSFTRHDPDLNPAPAAQAPHLTRDSTAQFYSKEAMLAALVESEGKNRMAFEYLMTWYLLTGQLGKLVQQSERLAEFGYTEIPLLWQEAILIYSYGTRQPVDLHGLTIHPEMQRRIEQFSGVVNRYGPNRDAAAAELARDYRGSYFFYYFTTILAARR